jgi:hypothetical protein
MAMAMKPRPALIPSAKVPGLRHDERRAGEPAERAAEQHRRAAARAAAAPRPPRRLGRSPTARSASPACVRVVHHQSAGTSR